MGDQMFDSLKALKEFYDVNGLDVLTDDLVAQAKACVTFEPVANADPLTVGCSRVGGLPDLPHDVAWPAGRLHPQSFLLQVRLSEIDRRVLDGTLPEEGLLWVFADWSSFEHHFHRSVGPEGAAVVYCASEAAPLERRELPAELPVVNDLPAILPGARVQPVFGIDPVGVDGFSTKNWPSGGVDIVKSATDHSNRNASEAQILERRLIRHYDDKLAVLDTIHRARWDALRRRGTKDFGEIVLGGHEDPLEHPPHDGSLVPILVEASGSGDLPSSRLEDWQQLLKIRLTSRVAPFWDIAITFFITRQDLVARRFDHCRCVFECD
jgi:hypothetical protein